MLFEETFTLSPETKNSNACPGDKIVAFAADGSDSSADKGEASVTAGELGLGKLAITTVSTGSTEYFGTAIVDVSNPDGKNTSKSSNC